MCLHISAEPCAILCGLMYWSVDGVFTSNVVTLKIAVPVR